MPNMPEALTALAGQIIAIEPTKNFDTKQPDGGVKCFIAAADGEGFSNVKLNPAAAAVHSPQLYANVVWMVKYGATGGKDRDASAYTTFIRPANENDVDRMHSIVGKVLATSK